MTTTDHTAHDVIMERLCADPDLSAFDAAQEAAEIIDTLTAAGYAVVRLPEPNRFPSGEVEWEFADPDMFGYVNINGETLEATVGDERIGDEGGIATLEGIVPTPDAARALAAALLAAADHQEKNQ